VQSLQITICNKKFTTITGTPREVCRWYLAGEGALGQGLVVTWEAGDAELELTDIQVQDVIDAIEGGLIKVVAVEED
jgi:hypothetical protein